jgi:Asp-tRNA(Asn)/Glu-tRNA(Gln) amidotransferase A subunit family amidase
MNAEEYLQHDGMALAGLVAAGEVTPAELLDAARARAAKVNPRINAIVRPMDAEADARVADGARLEGPFAGVPFLIKDLAQDYAGLPTSWGSRSLASAVATEHATVTQRWLDAGLVIFGKTNTPEFGAKGITEPELFGPTRNPWDLERTPGAAMPPVVKPIRSWPGGRSTSSANGRSGGGAQ